MYSEVHPKLEPVGLELVAESARRAGHECRLLDLQLFNHAEFARQLADFRPDAVGFSNNYLANEPETRDLARRIKRTLPGCFVFVGGHSASFIAAELLAQSGGCVDCVVRGEGEGVTPKLLEAAAAGRSVAGLPGITTAEGHGPPPMRVDSLDDIRPARDLTRRREKYFIGILDPAASIEFRRGCPWDCNFCSAWTFYGRKYRKGDPERIADELASIREPGVFIVDDVAFIDAEQGHAIADSVERRRVRKRNRRARRHGSPVRRGRDGYNTEQPAGTLMPPAEHHADGSGADTRRADDARPARGPAETARMPSGVSNPESPPMPPLKLGLAGMWHVHADGMIRRIAEHPDEFRLVGCWDPEPDVVAARRRTWEAKLPDLRFCGELPELLDLPLDGVVVEGRVYQNPWWALKALESGRPVLLEKPAGTDLDEFAELQRVAADKGLHLQMTYLFRYLNAVQELLAFRKGGGLGRVYEFRARMPKDLPGYRQYVDELGRYKGGMFFEMAGHMVDLAVTLLGAPAKVTPFLNHHHPTEPGAFVDNAVAVLEYDKAMAILEVTTLEVAPYGRRFEVYGTEGAFVIPHLGSGHLKNRDVQPIEIYRRGQEDWDRRELPTNPVQIGDLREFAAVLAGRKKPDYPAAHDLLVHEVLLKASGMV
jgi:predicted dehydrogenase